MNVRGIKIGRTLIRVKRISRLIVARFVQCSKIIPNLGDVGVESDGTRIGVQSIAILIDLVVQHANTAPECGVTSIAVDSLLVSLVCLGILLLGHVASAKKVPALCIGLI